MPWRQCSTRPLRCQDSVESGSSALALLRRSPLPQPQPARSALHRRLPRTHRESRALGRLRLPDLSQDLKFFTCEGVLLLGSGTISGRVNLQDTRCRRGQREHIVTPAGTTTSGYRNEVHHHHPVGVEGAAEAELRGALTYD